MAPCIYCHRAIPLPDQAFIVIDGRCVCSACWDARPGIDATDAPYATHKTVERYLLSHDGPWWVFPPQEPGQAQMRAIACVTPPPQGWCRHCGCKVAPDQLAATSVIAGTPLLWLGSHCWRCFELDPDCPTTCTILEEASDGDRRTGVLLSARR